MQNMELLLSCLEYIEEHLCDDIRTEDVAEACFCSKSTLEKLFRYVNHISVHDYVVRRRMTRAAKCLAEQPEASILDVAVEFGYSTHESFTRAFKQVWNCKPSEFRNAKFTDLFPRFTINLENGEERFMGKRVDISELYDLFQTRRNCYFVTCDIEHMITINEVSRKAGDLAILETLNRMKDAIGENDVIFRIGGDEFCILTDSTDQTYAEGVAAKICSKNGETFLAEEGQIPLKLHVFVVNMGEKCKKYSALFTGLHDAIQESKQKDVKIC